MPPNERINLTGVYQGGGKARLQVQRFEGHWVDFPVDTDVTGGLFTTYIYSGREGTNRFRVVDKTSGRASNAVRVTSASGRPSVSHRARPAGVSTPPRRGIHCGCTCVDSYDKS